MSELQETFRWCMKQLMARRAQLLAKPKASVHPCILCAGYEHNELGKSKNKTPKLIPGMWSIPYWGHGCLTPS